MSLLVILAVGIVGYQLVRRAPNFRAKLVTLLVVMVVISLVVASQP